VQPIQQAHPEDLLSPRPYTAVFSLFGEASILRKVDKTRPLFRPVDGAGGAAQSQGQPVSVAAHRGGTHLGKNIASIAAAIVVAHASGVLVSAGRCVVRNRNN
jgi:hypothetical protein